MGTLSARNLTEALSQARNLGLVEEHFVLENTSLAVRNLRPDQYDAIFKECQGLADVEYLNAWQMGHISRAICEINGIDLRDVTSIEEEEPDPKRPGHTRMVKLELHAWLKKNLLATWARESLYICYRKVADAIEAGEKKAQEGITFRASDESAEDKYRRLVGELKEVEEDVPEKILDGILRENGLMRRSTQEEVEAAASKLASLKETLPADEPVPSRVDTVEDEVESVQVAAPAPAPERKAGPPSPERMAQLLRNRVVPPAPVAEVAPVGAQPSPEPVETSPVPSVMSRTAELAALEGSFGSDQIPTAPVNLQPQGQVPEIRLGSAPKLDPQAATALVDTLPKGGVNPRFRPPTNL